MTLTTNYYNHTSICAMLQKDPFEHEKFFMDILCDTPPEFKIHLWDRLIEHVNLTINLL